MSLKNTIKKMLLGRYKSKEISFEEQKKMQIEMLKEVDAFCRVRNIRYCLGYGTMLGAVRHKGYIPWDDDVDILMPYPDMMRFKEEFRSDRYAYADIDTYKHFTFAFSRVYDKRTVTRAIPFGHTSYGICMDVYPVFGLPNDEKEIEPFMVELQKRLDAKEKIHVFQNKFNGRMPFRIYPLDKPTREYYDFIRQFPYEESSKFFCAGWPFIDQIFDVDYFANLIDADFEGERFLIPKEYDKYLTQRYGDYMQFPPEEKRIPMHNRVSYWK